MPCCNSCLVTQQSSAGNSRAFGIKHEQASFRSSAFRPRTSFPVPKHRGLWTRASAQESSNGYWEREEARWVREEGRWKREEQRWIREEQRWKDERATWSEESARMKEEIVSLRKEVEKYQAKQDTAASSASLSELLLGLKGLLQSLINSGTPTEAKPAVPVAASLEKDIPALTEVESIKFIVSDPPKSEETSKVLTTKDGTSSKQQRSLQLGAEGDDVKMLQEALAELGFNSGEDDMEYSVFASGTDSAVKSWQASIDAPEDGIVTADVFAQIVHGQSVLTVNNSAVIHTSPEESPETPSSSMSENRVYLLGENRWEDPRRLSKGNRKMNDAAAAQRCFTCKGEGRTLCSECEGTGELNVEEQFLEWAGEGAKCPYCEGSRTIACEDCDGKGSYYT